MSRLFTLLLCLLWFQAAAADLPDRSDQSDSSGNKETSLIKLLKSSAAPGEKALACKRLAVCGSKQAVPALAKLLEDPRLGSWARIALEAIPDPTADTALRRALSKLHGPLLVGVINSIAVRRDPKALPVLEKRLHDGDPAVAGASALALGCIGGPEAAKALAAALTRASSGNIPSFQNSILPSLSQGCILCAEKLLDRGGPVEAAKLFEAVRCAPVPREQMLEATRGAILASQPDVGLERLLDLLHSTDKGLYGMGLRLARELPGRSWTEALELELQRTPAQRQAILLLALGERHDPAALPTILAAARGGPKAVRLTALNLLEDRGDPSSIPVLLDTAADPDNELSQAAKGALTRFAGESVDDQIVSRLPGVSGRTRQVLIELASARHLVRSLPEIVRATADSESNTRCAAIQAIGVLGDGAQAAALVELLPKYADAKERATTEAALIGISGRDGPGALKHLLPLAESDQPALRTIAIHALSSAGGPPALSAVEKAAQDPDESVQDEAVRALSTWPNNWPDDASVAQPLLELVRTSTKTSHQVLAVRGYLECLHADKKLRPDEKVSRLNDLRPFLKRAEEQRLAITTIEGIATPATVQLLTDFAAEPAVADDACSALLKLASAKDSKLSKSERDAALTAVSTYSKTDGSKQKARALLEEK